MKIKQYRLIEVRNKSNILRTDTNLEDLYDQFHSLIEDENKWRNYDYSLVLIEVGSKNICARFEVYSTKAE